MGNGGSSEQKTPFLEDDPESWKVSHVTALYDHYEVNNFDFGLQRYELEAIFNAVIPDEAGDVVGKLLWPRFADYNDGKEVNALELLAALTIVSLGDMESKYNLIFRIFDLNQNNSFSYDELCLALSSTLAGTALYLRRGTLTSDQAMEPHTDAAFVYTKKDTSSRLSKDEIWHFFENKHFPHLCHTHAIPRISSPIALLACFGLTDNFTPEHKLVASSASSPTIVDETQLDDHSVISSNPDRTLTKVMPASRRRDLFPSLQ